MKKKLCCLYLAFLLLLVLTGCLGKDLPETEPESQTESQRMDADQGNLYGAYIPDVPNAYPRSFHNAEHSRELLTDLQKCFYDAEVKVLSNPYLKNNFIEFLWPTLLTEQEMSDASQAASWAIQLDHPEFFYNYQYIDFKYLIAGPGYLGKQGDSHRYYVSMPQGGPELAQMISDFNAAAEQYMTQLTEFGSQTETARQIHDLMLQNISYDHAAAENNQISPLSYCAYGALVENSLGEPRKAVCNGYANAFLYLSQMAGCDGVILTGFAGEGYNTIHAWNLMKLDGVWKEVDVTWDDSDRFSPDDPRYEELSHRCFCISTDEMSRIGGMDGRMRRRLLPGDLAYVGEFPIAP